MPWIVPKRRDWLLPLGAQIIKQMRPETFRRICMSFDAWVVAFGMSTDSRPPNSFRPNAAYLLLAVVIVLETPCCCIASSP